MISVVASVALAVFSARQVYGASQTVCSRAVNVEFDKRELYDLYGGVYVLDVSDDAAAATYTREDGEYCMFTSDDDTVAFGKTCGGAVIVEDSAFEDACMNYFGRSDSTVTVGSDITEEQVTYFTLPGPCSECRQVLAGDLAGNYTLAIPYSSYCDPKTDGCVYSLGNQNYCFQGNGLYDTMLTCN